MIRTRLVSLLVSVLLGVAGCGGSSSESPPVPPAPPPITKAEAFQFLNQATFGATETEAERLIGLRFEAWIDDQLRQPPSLQLPHMLALPPPDFMGQLHPDRVDIWFRNSLWGDDQLRQRVAFALSEILVVSQIGALQSRPFAVADYYDLLARNAFGNYRDLIEAVTLRWAFTSACWATSGRIPISISVPTKTTPES